MRSSEPIQVTFNRDHTTAQILVPLVGNGSDRRSMARSLTLRNRVLPAQHRQAAAAHSSR